MTTQFNSKLSAIKIGMMYAGRKDLYLDKNKEEKSPEKSLEDILKNPEIKVLDGSIEQFGYIHEDALLMEFLNSKNHVCRIATTKFRDGFDLWLIDPESGIARRV